MTTSPSEPPDTSTSASPRRSSLPWVIGGAVVVVAAVVTSILVTGGDDSGGGQAGGAATTTTPTSTFEQPAESEKLATYDLSTPEAAAASFAAAASTGNGDTLLGLACVGRLACVAEHVPDATEEQLTEGRNQILEGVFELSEHLKGAQFGAAVDGAQPGTKDVPYRTPEMAPESQLTLTFVQSEGQWLYYRLA
jgi:hypothetical protein